MAVDPRRAGPSPVESLRARLAAVPPTGPPSSPSAPADAPAPFPTDVLPPAVRQYVEAGAAAFGVPADMIAVPLLGFAAGAIGRTLAIELKLGRREWPILWLAVIGRPGTGKSPALDYARGPLDRLQDAAWARYELRLSAWEAEQRDAKTGRGLTAGGGESRPEPESFFTTDATIEALARMASHGAGLAVIRDELIGWVKSHDAYKAGGDRQTHLSLWAGSRLKVDRKTAAPLYVPRPCVSVVGGIQPDRLADLRAEAGQDDGFVDRFLACWPDAAPQRWSDDAVSDVTVEAAVALFGRLRHIRADGISAVTRPETVATLTPAALRAFIAWHDDNADSIATAHGLAAGCAAKYPRQIARVAAVLHALHDPDDPGRAVTADTIEGAVEVIEYFRAHSARMLAALGSPGGSRAVAVPDRVVRALDRDGGGWVARTTLHRRLGNSVAAATLGTALAQLTAAGRVESRIVPTDGHPREEWRRGLPGADCNMKNEESPPTAADDARADPFVHSSYRNLKDAHEANVLPADCLAPRMCERRGPCERHERGDPCTIAAPAPNGDPHD